VFRGEERYFDFDVIGPFHVGIPLFVRPNPTTFLGGNKGDYYPLDQYQARMHGTAPATTPAAVPRRLPRLAKTLTAAERIELDPSPEPEMATLYEPATGRGRNLLGLNAALADPGH
jgi:hypothetical protein